MSPRPPQPPNPVPEEDLNLHENFAPIIAENGRIRQPKDTQEPIEFTTQSNTLQDLVQLRRPIPKEPPPDKTAAGPRPPKAKEKQQDSAPTFITVRTTTTALAPVSKMTLPRRIALLKRKRQHKRRLVERAKKRAAQAAVVPQTPTQKSAQTPQKPNRGKWVLAVLLFLFLGGIGGLVPVEKIPFLRNLAYAMGFDKTDTSRMSFLRALLTWTDKEIGLPGNWTDEAEESTSLFARRGSAGNDPFDTDEENGALPGLNALGRSGGQTSLIDIKALNALQLKRGQALDGVRGAVPVPLGRDEADLGPAVIRDSNVNVQTESSRDQGEVFFGSDNSAINRNFKDGYDSTKTLAKVKNPHIADGKPIDWLMNTTQQLMRTNSPLGGSNRQLSGTHVSWGDGLATLGEQKPHRDLYHAWITSRASNRTPNTMLKKSLVDTGFLGAEMPTMSSVSIGGGVQIDSTSFQENQEEWKEYLEWEQKCKETLGKEGGKITELLKDFENKVRSKSTDLNYPANCYETIEGKFKKENFVASVGNIKKTCEQIQASYDALEEDCAMEVTKGICTDLPEDYGSEWDKNMKQCNLKFQEQFKTWKESLPEEQRATVTPAQYKGTDDWKNKGQTIQTNFSDVIDSMKKDGGKFSTWIRGKECGPDYNNLRSCIAEEEQLDNVQDTIGNNIPGVFKN